MNDNHDPLGIPRGLVFAAGLCLVSYALTGLIWYLLASV
jgi:hypothetical protein